jgi:predicted nucleic acid-binding protein
VILVDTSIWIDHLRTGDVELSQLLDDRDVLAHPFVIGEIALGRLRQRDLVIRRLSQLPSASVATDAEVLHLIESNALFGLGIGYVDAHLLAAARLTPGAKLWTRDQRLAAAAQLLGLNGPRISN